jgi:hypothetical protein
MTTGVTQQQKISRRVRSERREYFICCFSAAANRNDDVISLPRPANPATSA